MTGRCRVFAGLSGFLLLAVVPCASASIEDAVPHGGAGITKRVCVDGPNQGDSCNENADCSPGTCFPYNVIDLTVNLSGYVEGQPAVPTAQELQTLEDHFIEISNLLYDVTDGQMLIGTVIFVVDNGAPEAVVQVQSASCLGFSCGGFCIDDGDCGDQQLCSQGECCEVVFSGNVFEEASCQDPDFPTYFYAPYNQATLGGWELDGGKITITVRCLDQESCFVHEFMHYVAGVRDEYHGHPDYCASDYGQNWWKFRCFGGKDDNEQCNPDVDCAFGVCDPDTNTCTADDSPCDPHADCAPQGQEQGYCRKIVCIDPGPPEDPLDTPGCLMRGSGNNPDSEICYDGNHDLPDFDTAQSQCNGQSCWDQFAEEWPSLIELPAGAPQDGPSPAPVAPQFIVVDNLQGRFVTVIDRSGSMTEENPRRIDLAVDVTKDFVTLLESDAEYGLVSFSYMGPFSDPPDEDATKDFPGEAGLRLLDSNADRNEARSAIDDLGDRAGGGTRIGEGLRLAKQTLEENGGQITLDTAVVLVTDGLNNEPAGMAQQDLDDALQMFQESDLPVYVTCIGEAADTDQCAYIADASNGLFVASEQTAGLIDAFIQFAVDAQKLGMAESLTGMPILPAQALGPFPVYVEAGARSVTFEINWTESTSDVNLLLNGPDGTTFSCPALPLTHGKYCEVQQPLAGTWMASVVAAQILVGDETISLRAIVDNDRVRLDAGLQRARVSWPEPFGLSASATVGGMLVGGCAAEVLVQKPDGTVETIALRDDGLGGDAERDDGTYQGEFANYSVNGDYTFNLAIGCDQGTAFFPNEPDNLDGDPLPEPISFERRARFSGSITDAPRDLPPIAEICPEVIDVPCDTAQTPVFLDGTCSKDPDGLGLQYAWSAPTGVLNQPASPTPFVLLPTGAHDVFLTVTDASGQTSAPDRVGIVVSDSTPPSLSVAVSPGVLWPPNHRMVDVLAAPVTVFDSCDPAPSLVLDAVVSDEPDDAPGVSDGATIDDVQDASPGTADTSLLLRAERDSTGDGRVYRASYSARDASGNDATVVAPVSVPVVLAGIPVEPLDIRLEEQRTGTVVRWGPVSGAASYNVIRGLLDAVAESDSVYDLGQVVCIEADSTDESTSGNEDAEQPLPGAVFFYLAEYEAPDGSASSYSTETASKPRIPASGGCGP